MKREKKNEKKGSILKSLKFTTVIEMIFSLLTIPMTLGYLKAEIMGEEQKKVLSGFIVVVFFVTAVARWLRARRMRLSGKPRAKYNMQRVYSLAFLACSILPFFFEYVKGAGLQNYQEITGWCGDVRQAVGLVFWSVMAAGRIVSIVRDHRWRKRIVNIILVLLLALTGLSCFVYCDVVIAMTLSVALSLGEIFTVVFARIHMDALKKIVRKTYASEIILGLLLLIFAFSYVLEFCEDGIQSFPDGLWYCFAIVTTIGFGDITATSFIGRALSVVLGIYGIVVVALITSIIVNFYGEVRREPDEPDETGETEESVES